MNDSSVIDRALSLLDVPWGVVTRTKGIRERLKKSDLRAPYPILRESSSSLMGEVEHPGFWADADPGCLEQKLNMTAFTNGEAGGDYTLSIRRYIEVGRKAVRGHIQRFRSNERYFRTDLVGVTSLDGSDTHSMFFAWSPISGLRIDGWGYSGGVGRGGFVTTGGLPKDAVEDIKANFQLSCAMQFNAEYSWNVRVLRDDGPGVSFYTDPLGAREAFRLRDVEEGKSRRSAIRNWVKEHWRKRRAEDDIKTVQVKKHLRGVQRFTWCGYTIEIAPPLMDLKEMQDRRQAEEAQCTNK